MGLGGNDMNEWLEKTWLECPDRRAFIVPVYCPKETTPDSYLVLCGENKLDAKQMGVFRTINQAKQWVTNNLELDYDQYQKRQTQRQKEIDKVLDAISQENQK